jgi:hypothetical protein
MFTDEDLRFAVAVSIIKNKHLSLSLASNKEIIEEPLSEDFMKFAKENSDKEMPTTSTLKTKLTDQRDQGKWR